MAVWTVRADYDADARVWWTADSDIPGLAADAATLEELAEKVGRLLPDLLEIDGGHLLTPERRQGPHELRIIAHHERSFPVAA